jgi:hypothetical protein
VCRLVRLQGHASLRDFPTDSSRRFDEEVAKDAGQTWGGNAWDSRVSKLRGFKSQRTVASTGDRAPAMDGSGVQRQESPIEIFLSPPSRPHGPIFHKKRTSHSQSPPLVSIIEKAPQVGLEPTTLRLTAGCSAIELLRSNTATAMAPTQFMERSKAGNAVSMWVSG